MVKDIYNIAHFINRYYRILKNNKDIGVLSINYNKNKTIKSVKLNHRLNIKNFDEELILLFDI